jgi:hypothetical protein
MGRSLRGSENNDLRDLIITDYTNNGRKSFGDLKTTRLPRLDGALRARRRSTLRRRRSSATRRFGWLPRAGEA